MAQIRSVSLIGAGTIGASWALACLARGLDVRVWDPDDATQERLASFIEKGWPIVRELGLSPKASKERWQVFWRMEDALKGADFVQESGPEDPEIKTGLMARIDAGLPKKVVIASSSTALPVSSFQGKAKHPERIVLGHPFNPPHLMPLVEVGGGERTADWAIERAMAVYEQLGKMPVRLRAEIPGHLANRLQAAVYREAVYLVEQGYATVEDIDKAMRGGPGLRWAFMGPHLTYHLGGGEGGIARYFEILGESQQRRWAALGEPEFTEQTQAKIIEEMSAATQGQEITDLALRRDRTLLALLKTLASQGELTEPAKKEAEQEDDSRDP